MADKGTADAGIAPGRALRFKDENGADYPEWRTVLLSDLLHERKMRNKKLDYGREDVLSVSGDLGVVNQIELLGRSYAGVSLAQYQVVEPGDIVYTKSPLKANPYGIIKVNKGAAGIVSTLYAVYRCKPRVSGIYLDYYFQLDEHLNEYLRPLVHKGAKNDMKISNAKVLSDVITVPSYEEQCRIVVFLGAVDNKMDGLSAVLNHTRAYKAGLLQQLFPARA